MPLLSGREKASFALRVPPKRELGLAAFFTPVLRLFGSYSACSVHVVLLVLLVLRYLTPPQSTTSRNSSSGHCCSFAFKGPHPPRCTFHPVNAARSPYLPLAPCPRKDVSDPSVTLPRYDNVICAKALRLDRLPKPRSSRLRRKAPYGAPAGIGERSGGTTSWRKEQAQRRMFQVRRPRSRPGGSGGDDGVLASYYLQNVEAIGRVSCPCCGRSYLFCYVSFVRL